MPRWRRTPLLLVVAAVALGVPLVAPVGASARAAVYPEPGSRYVAAGTEISFRGVSPQAVALSVRGTRTGPHGGRVRAHADGKGASWVPAAPFAEGETVTVATTVPVLGVAGPSFSYTVARTVPFSRTGVDVPPGPPALLSYRSTDLRPVATTTLTAANGTAPGLTFTAPQGPRGSRGAQVLDDAGEVVWWKPTAGYVLDFKVQRYQGKAVLTWFEGDLVQPGLGRGVHVIADTSYRVLKRVPAQGGLVADHHDFQITPRGTALTASYVPVRVDTRAAGGVRDGRVFDNVVQEIDLASGRLLFEWHALDHLGVGETYAGIPTENRSVLDFAHINSVREYGTGALLLSFRATHALVKIDRRSGDVAWRLGGKRSDFRFVGGRGFSSQHDATPRADGTIALFDNALGVGPSTASSSRGLVLRLDQGRRTATLVRQLRTPAGLPLPARSAGSQQRLTGGGYLLGFGSAGAWLEFGPGGSVVQARRFTQPGVTTYRAYKNVWHATPVTAPDVAAARDGAGVAVWASWNGATEVVAWRVLAGPTATSLVAAGTADRSGFETPLRAPAESAFVAVQALDARGAVLRTSPAVAVTVTP